MGSFRGTASALPEWMAMAINNPRPAGLLSLLFLWLRLGHPYLHISSYIFVCDPPDHFIRFKRVIPLAF
ncbi:hypothetical protein O181_059452 [Austropuccinia psidii MF-1]|uniref:Uncharacterized protein n=1 Tax=Austropuccinia psidii MF-1 TaxID=1389203 RepID=A0A9Q3ELN7_9BASI|nr:hypothetical protein [Austropuccinia psidii MF-1]